MNSWYSLILLILLPFYTVAQQPLGAGSYNPNAPGPSVFEGPFVSENFDKPIITHDWWTSILWSKWQNPTGFSNIIHPHPFSARCQPGGLGLGYAKDATIYNGNVGTSFDNVYNHFYQDDLVVGLEGVSFNDTRVSDYSDWDVEALWVNNDDSLKARLGHGFTFVYFTKSGNKNVSITTLGENELVNNCLKIEINGKYYGVFAPTGSTWEKSNTVYTSSLDNKDYWSIALLPDGEPSTFEKFKEVAFNFVTKTDVAYEWDESTGFLNTSFTPLIEPKEGNGTETFMALYRHQWLYSPDINTDFEYNSPRGKMKVTQGAKFETSMANIGSIPSLPLTNNSDQTKLAQLVKTFAGRPVYNCQGENCNWGYYGNYTMGRFLIQAGQVALLADELNDADSRNKLVNWIKSELEDYFTYSGDSRWIGYNDHWGITLLHSDNIEHCSIDCLNDRNLQYGYWIRAAAIVEKFNPGWASESGFGPMIDLLINDVANTDRSNELFPFLRNFDPYAGHSWALGFSDLSDGADQESSSESINFASALIFYGQVTNQLDLVEKGMWMYTTEVIATEQYWFDVDEEVFPEGFYPEMAGLIRSSGTFYQLWWELRPEHVLMVNCFPWTGGALYLGRHPEACERIYDWISTGAGQNGIQKWQGYLWPYLSLFDPERAINEYEASNYDFSIELESEANNYHWLSTLEELGQVDQNIHSTWESAIVFDKEGDKNYVVYNPYSEEQIVYFSDETRFSVPEDTTIVLKKGDQWEVTGIQSEKSIRLELHPNPASNYLEISGKGSWEILNHLGNVVLYGSSNHIDIQLPKGVYTVRRSNMIERFIII
jgi:endoglucanase Acf2